MASKINADTSAGLKLTSDTSGDLELQSAGTTKAKITSSGLTDTSNNAITAQSGKNRIINGNMVIDQRNSGASVTPAIGTYTLDRYRAYQNATGKYTLQQSSTAPVGFSNSVAITSTSAHTVAAGELFLFMQYIEGYNVADLEWGTSDAKPITISFWIRSSLTGTFGGALLNGSESRNYPFTYTISNADTWEKKSVTIAGDTTGTWLKTNGLGLEVNFSLGMGSNYTGTAGAWASGAKFSATGATSVVSTSGATWYMTGLQVEKGTTATPFEHRPYDMELLRCFRYFEKFGGGNIHGGSYNGSTTIGHLQYKARKRTTPTVSGTNGSNISSVVAGIDNFHFTGSQPSYVITALINAEF